MCTSLRRSASSPTGSLFSSCCWTRTRQEQGQGGHWGLSLLGAGPVCGLEGRDVGRQGCAGAHPTDPSVSPPAGPCLCSHLHGSGPGALCQLQPLPQLWGMCAGTGPLLCLEPQCLPQGHPTFPGTLTVSAAPSATPLHPTAPHCPALTLFPGSGHRTSRTLTRSGSARWPTPPSLVPASS